MNFWIRIILCCLPSALHAAEINQDLKRNLTSPDAVTRAQALSGIFHTLKENSEDKDIKEVLPFCVGSLKDPDAAVRRKAINYLRIIIAGSTPSVQSTPFGDELATDASIRQAIMKAIDDPDAQVRQLGLQTFALTYKMTPEIEDKIIAENRADGPLISHLPTGPDALIQILLIGASPSPKAISYLSELLDDPKLGQIIAEDIGAANCPLSDAVLDKLMAKLSAENDPTVQQTYIRAVGTYGKRAKRYQPQLQTILDRSTDGIVGSGY